MLVLGRKVSESIVICYGPNEADRVVITIVRIGSKIVRMGFVAGEQITILRSELLLPNDDAIPPSSDEPAE